MVRRTLEEHSLEERAALIMSFKIGDGKADYLSVDPTTGTINAYINNCAGTATPDSGNGGGGEDGSNESGNNGVDSKLPQPTGTIKVPVDYCAKNNGMWIS